LNNYSKYSVKFLLFVLLLIIFILINLSLGSVDIPLKSILYTLTGNDIAKESWQYIILQYRVPKAITAVLVGSGLSICGLLMQTLFRNPLAGPFVLGITIISVLAYFSSAENLQQYVFWTFGSLGNLGWDEILILSIIYILSISILLTIIKPLNSLLLGENYAVSLGVNLKKTRNITLLVTGLLTGVITAFSGPIAFIGLAVPHLTKLLIKTSNHRVLLPSVAVAGAIVMLISDTIAQLPNSEYSLPINAVTSLFGAPIVIWLLVRKRKISY